MKSRIITINAQLDLMEKMVPAKVVITKKLLKKAVVNIGRELKQHFKQKDAWSIRAEEYVADALYSQLRFHLSDYIQLLILKELGPKFVLTWCKGEKSGQFFYGFKKRTSRGKNTKQRND